MSEHEITIEERNAALDRAKARVLAGWCQGHYGETCEGLAIQSPGGLGNAVRFCAYGACHAEKDIALDDAATKALCAAVQTLWQAGKIQQERPAEYNDAPGRTKYEVAALFDHAKEQPL